MAVVLHSAAPAKELAPAEWPPALRYEVAAVAAHSAVRTDTVRVYKCPTAAGDQVVITCDVRRGLPAEEKDARIRVVEPIALLYRDPGLIRSTAPWVYSGREDFPRDLPHQNPVGDASPASLCVSRVGSQPVYDAGGIGQLLDRISNWLCDAAGAALEHDGWDPMPHVLKVHATMDAAWFQNAALANASATPVKMWGIGDIALSQTQKLSKLKYWDVRLRTPELPWPELESREVTVRTKIDSEDYWAEAPWIFVTGSTSAVNGARLNNSVDTLEDLFKVAAAAGCEAELRGVLEQKPAPKALASAKLALFVIGIWRPLPMIPDLPGLADGPARKLELRAFLGLTDVKEGSLVVSGLLELPIAAEPTPELLAKMSGLSRVPDACALLGTGALGSKLAVFLAREGIGYMSLTDEDTLEPHNLTRHVLTGRHVGFAKAKGVKALLEDIRKDTLEARARTESAETIASGDFQEVFGKRPKWIIDATADRRALARLMQHDNTLRVIRTEMSDAGKLGVLSVEGAGRNPDIYDIQAYLYASADEVIEVGDWLTNGEALAEVRTGLSCASITFQLPDSTVALHASAFMAEINRVLADEDDEPGVLVNLATDKGRPEGSLWIPVEPFKPIKMELSPGQKAKDRWYVRMHPDALDLIEQHRKESLPNEGGGYLYGTYDVANRVIRVARAFPVKPLSASPTDVKLPAAGRSHAEVELLAHTGGTITCVGSWHTHTAGDGGWSPTDQQQGQKISKDNKSTPKPMAMMIFAPKGHKAYLIEPAE